MPKQGMLVIVIVSVVLCVVIGCNTSGNNKEQSSTIVSKIVRVSKLPNESILLPTDDFELITENLPKPIISNPAPEKDNFNPWMPDNFQGIGKLTLQWERKDFRKRIAGGYDYDVGFFSHPSGWCFGKTIVNPANNKPIKGNTIPAKVLLNIENKTYYTYDETNPLFSAGGTTAIRTLHEYNGDAIWKLEMPTSNPTRVFFLSNLMVVMMSGDGIYGYDIATGQARWKLAHKHLDTDGFLKKPVLTEKYFWFFAYDSAGNDYLYRAQLLGEDVELLRYNLENPDRVRITDEYLYIITDKQKTLLEIGIDDGVLVDTYQIEDYIPDAELWGSLHLEHPFWCYTPDANHIFNPNKPDKPIRVEGHLREVRRNTYKWQGWDNYWGEDEDTIYGLDTKTGERTWWIPLDELGDDAEVLIADWRGVLIGHGNKVSAYGVKE
ncbi:MAG: hypothetical protein KAH30_06695 [Caldisericia bacterium]|nr:hypothetical protein [Caldisericia bacterium]